MPAIPYYKIITGKAESVFRETRGGKFVSKKIMKRLSVTVILTIALSVSILGMASPVKASTGARVQPASCVWAVRKMVQKDAPLYTLSAFLYGNGCGSFYTWASIDVYDGFPIGYTIEGYNTVADELTCFTSIPAGPAYSIGCATSTVSNVNSMSLYGANLYQGSTLVDEVWSRFD
jgi:hypothetical protein